MILEGMFGLERVGWDGDGGREDKKHREWTLLV